FIEQFTAKKDRRSISAVFPARTFLSRSPLRSDKFVPSIGTTYSAASGCRRTSSQADGSLHRVLARRPPVPHLYDAATATLSGNPIVLGEQLAEDSLGRSGGSVAGAGTLVYTPAPYPHRQLVWVDRAGGGCRRRCRA